MKRRHKENLSKKYFVLRSLRLQKWDCCCCIFFLCQDIRAKPSPCVKIYLRGLGPRICWNEFWFQSFATTIFQFHQKFQEMEIYFRNCWPMQCLRPSLLVNIYPRPAQGTRKHATDSEKSRSSSTHLCWNYENCDAMMKNANMHKNLEKTLFA